MNKAFNHEYRSSRPINGGMQYVFKFPNNLGASVVKHDFSYGNSEGLWELAVLGWENDNSYLNYDTPITDDVIGHLSELEVEQILNDIKELENKEE